MKWIPMSEHKPTKKGRYMVTFSYFYLGKYHYEVDTDDWDDLGEFFEEYKDTVTALAELPKPYEGK